VVLKPKTKILIFGTFDMVHPGHDHLFQQARLLAKKGTEPFLIVSIARDKNVAKIKGRLPKFTEKQRLEKVKNTLGVNKAILGALGNHIPPIVKINPDVIGIGYDQRAYVRGLRTALNQAGINPKIVRLKPHKPHLYKTSLLLK
jgi:FAD synthetase